MENDGSLSVRPCPDVGISLHKTESLGPTSLDENFLEIILGPPVIMLMQIGIGPGEPKVPLSFLARKQNRIE